MGYVKRTETNPSPNQQEAIPTQEEGETGRDTMSVGERRGHDRCRCTGGLGRVGERLLGRLRGARLGEGVGSAGG